MNWMQAWEAPCSKRYNYIAPYCKEYSLTNCISKPTSAVNRCIPWRMSAMSHMFPPLSHFPGAVNSQVSGSPLWTLWQTSCPNLGLLKSLHLIPDREVFQPANVGTILLHCVAPWKTRSSPLWKFHVSSHVRLNWLVHFGYNFWPDTLIAKIK